MHVVYDSIPYLENVMVEITASKSARDPRSIGSSSSSVGPVATTVCIRSNNETTMMLSNRRIYLSLLLTALLVCIAPTNALLTPAMTPQQALQQDDMARVFGYASPNNRANVGGSIERFGTMVRSGPYKYLIRHKRADVLLTVSSSSNPQRWRGLVRVSCSDECDKETTEFWWLLSRCGEGGDYPGCFMVDAVIPNA